MLLLILRLTQNNNKMKIGLSLLSKMRSFLGVQIGHSGYLKKDDKGFPMLVRTLEIEIGFIFGWITFNFNHGGQISLDEINKSLREEVIKGKKIG
jgi:hypothetical protein